jgi:hypothetical protein
VAEDAAYGTAVNKLNFDFRPGRSPKTISQFDTRKLNPGSLRYLGLSIQGTLGQELCFQVTEERVPSHMVRLGCSMGVGRIQETFVPRLDNLEWLWSQWGKYVKRHQIASKYD